MFENGAFWSRRVRTCSPLLCPGGRGVWMFMAQSPSFGACSIRKTGSHFSGACAVLHLAHVLFGKPVPTFPEHALSFIWRMFYSENRFPLFRSMRCPSFGACSIRKTGSHFSGACAVLHLAHVLFGKPVPTFPEHALSFIWRMFYSENRFPLFRSMRCPSFGACSIRKTGS